MDWPHFIADNAWVYQRTTGDQAQISKSMKISQSDIHYLLRCSYNTRLRSSWFCELSQEQSQAIHSRGQDMIWRLLPFPFRQEYQECTSQDSHTYLEQQPSRVHRSWLSHLLTLLQLSSVWVTQHMCTRTYQLPRRGTFGHRIHNLIGGQHRMDHSHQI